jgi:hypothetical protein
LSYCIFEAFVDHLVFIIFKLLTAAAAVLAEAGHVVELVSLLVGAAGGLLITFIKFGKTIVQGLLVEKNGVLRECEPHADEVS